MSDGLKVGLFLAAVAIWVVMLALMSVARAHSAPSGWPYAPGCCSGIHCSPLPADQVKRTAEGYLIVPTGELIPYEAANSSPDGEYHYCTARDRHPPQGVFEWDRVRETDQLHEPTSRRDPMQNRSKECFWAPNMGVER